MNLTKPDFDAILDAISAEIRKELAPHRARIKAAHKVTAAALRRSMAKRGAKAAHVQKKPTAKPTGATAGDSNPTRFAKARSMSTATSPGLQQRVERLEHAAKSDRANLSAEAAEFAYRSCYAKQAAGETVDFAAEHKKVLSELQANPQSVRARYAKENSYKPDPFPNIQRGAPGDTIQSYESLGDRISRIAKRRAGEGADSQILDQVKRQVHQEIFEALDKKINSQRAAEIYAKNDDEYLEFASAHGSMSSRASAMAIRRCKGQLSGFQEAYSDALDELRREWATRD